MSFLRYPTYKDSGVEWLGEVPAHWGIARLGFECETIVPMRDKPEHLGGEIPWIRIEDFNGKFIGDSKSDQGVSQETVKAMNLKVLPVGAVLCSCSCSMGATAIVAKPLVTNQTFIGVVPSKTFSSDYLYFFFHTAADHLDSIGTGAIQTYLSRDDFRRLRLPCPPFPEQTKIAAFLDRETAKIDGLIGDQRRLMELLKEKRQAVISHAVTRGLNPHAPMKPSGIEWLGDVPAHWEVGPLKRFWSVTDCKHVTAEFVDNGIPLASIREVQSRWVALEGAKCTTEHFYSLLIEGGRQPLPGDLIFSRNATVGEVAQVHADHPRFALGQDVVLLRKISPSDSSDYMQQVIRSPIIILQLANMMIGSTFKRINVEEIRSFLMPSPPSAEQAEIATFLESESAKFDTLTTEAQRAIDLLQERRTALISAAVTGQIDVRGAVY